jgi:diadenosine tetraphosphatase ApaH/serine/threonine PP2A family protein phosphatase
MGNHDSACCELEDPDAVAENRNFDVDVATRRLLTFGQMAWLMARPHIWCCPAFACTHGDFSSPKEWLYIVDPKDARLSLWYRSEPVLFVGHTHIPSLMKISAEDAELARSFDEDDVAQGLRGLKEIGLKSCTVSGGARYVVNVGSVGLPREGSCGTYCTYDVQSGRLQFVFLEK